MMETKTQNNENIDFKMLSKINLNLWFKIFLYSLIEKTKINLEKMLNIHAEKVFVFCLFVIFSLFIFKNYANIGNLEIIKLFVISFLEYILYIIPISISFVLLINVEDDIAKNDFYEKIIEANLLKTSPAILKRRSNTFKNESYKTGNYSTIITNRFDWLWNILKLSFLKYIISPLEYDMRITKFLEKTIFDMIKNLKFQNDYDIKNTLSTPLFYVYTDKEKYNIFVYDKNIMNVNEIVTRCFSGNPLCEQPLIDEFLDDYEYDKLKNILMKKHNKNKFETEFLTKNDNYVVLKIKFK